MKNDLSSTNVFARSVNFLSDVFGVLSACAIIVATAAITEGVIVRYVFRIPTVWQVELAVYMLIFATFLGAPYALKEGAHINIDLVTSMLSPRINAWLDLFTSIIAMLFCILLAWKGWVMWYEAYDGGFVSESMWSVPLVYPYLILPLGMSLTALQYTLMIAGRYRVLRGLIRGDNQLALEAE